MITDIILYLISLVLTLMFTISDAISSGWSVWPSSVLDGITYLLQQLMVFNFLFPIDTLFTVMVFILNFEAIYLSVKVLLKLFNWLRGASGIEI
jgi:hypothetical protein